MKTLILKQWTSLFIISLFSVQALTQETFSIQNYVEVLKQNKVDTVEKALQYLPDVFKQNYVLMKNSTSLQPSNALNPRALLFDPQGQTVLTFNGHPKHNGYHSLETVGVENNEIVFREILFKGETLNEPAFTDPELDYESPQFAVSSANPSKCMSCHTMNVDLSRMKQPRYFWSGLNQWQGAFGGNDDQLDAVLDYKDVITRDEKLKKDWDAFIANSKTHPRYSQLLPNQLSQPNRTFTQFIARNYTQVKAAQMIETLAESEVSSDDLKQWLCNGNTPSTQIQNLLNARSVVDNLTPPIDVYFQNTANPSLMLQWKTGIQNDQGESYNLKQLFEKTLRESLESRNSLDCSL